MILSWPVPSLPWNVQKGSLFSPVVPQSIRFFCLFNQVDIAHEGNLADVCGNHMGRAGKARGMALEAVPNQLRPLFNPCSEMVDAGIHLKIQPQLELFGGEDFV